MIIGFRKNRIQPNSVVIEWIEAERVNAHKYLRVVFDRSLNCKENRYQIPS